MFVILSIFEAVIFFLVGIIFCFGFLGGLLFGIYDSKSITISIEGETETKLAEMRKNASKLIGYGLGHTTGLYLAKKK